MFPGVNEKIGKYDCVLVEHLKFIFYELLGVSVNSNVNFIYFFK